MILRVVCGGAMFARDRGWGSSMGDGGATIYGL